MRCLGPQKLAALLQPFIQRIEVRKGGHELPKPMAGVAHILLNLTFLPPCRGIAELRVKDIMAGHRKEPCVYIALLSDANPVDGCLHVVIDATPRNTLKHSKAMPVGIEQHLMRLQPIGPDQKCAAV